MPRRSLLFSPGDEPELMGKAPESGADTVIFDLEDAVAPASKQTAREAVADVLADPAFAPDCEVCVRVNAAPETAAEDVAAILSGDVRIDAVMVPKVESPDDVAQISAMVSENGFELPIIAVCESAAGVLSAREIAAADPVAAIAFGAEDLSADIGASRTDSGEEVSYARQHIVLAASAAGVDAIDTPCLDLDRTDRVAEEASFARQLGYDGKMAVHPEQVGEINRAFTPDADAVEWATKVLAAAETAEESGRGVFRVDGEMVDAPLIERAETIVERHRAADTDDS